MKVITKESKAVENARVSYDSQVEAFDVSIRKKKIEHNIIDGYPTISNTGAKGELLSIEVLVPVTQWTVAPDFPFPSSFSEGTVYLTEGVEEEVLYKTNEDHSILCIKKECPEPIKFIKLAKNVTVGVSKDNKLAEVWISGINVEQ